MTQHPTSRRVPGSRAQLVERPAIFLGHPAARGSHGPGARWCAMGAPRPFERGDGRLGFLAPDRDLVRLVKSGRMEPSDYRAAFMERMEACMERGLLRPGTLAAVRNADGASVVVEHGDTAWCACGRQAALEGRCHLAWALPFLGSAGWAVRLFGRRPEDLAQISLFGNAL